MACILLIHVPCACAVTVLRRHDPCKGFGPAFTFCFLPYAGHALVEFQQTQNLGFLLTLRLCLRLGCSVHHLMWLQAHFAWAGGLSVTRAL